jgi:drug/metabolite transporter (DMT)-like permease
MTTSRYTVKNIVAVIVAMVFAVGMALYAFFGNPSRGTPGVMGVFFTVFAVVLGWIAIKAIRNRRR